MGNVPLTASPTITIRGHPNDKGIYMALHEAKASTMAEVQINGFLKPSLWDNQGTRKIVGMDTHCIIDVINAAEVGDAPFSIINFGVHPDQV
jgi:hypothetical protein